MMMKMMVVMIMMMILSKFTLALRYWNRLIQLSNVVSAVSSGMDGGGVCVCPS